MVRVFVTVAAVLLLVSCSDSETNESSVFFPDSIVAEEIVATVNTVPVTGRDLKSFSVAYQPSSVDSMHSRLFNLELLSGYIDRVLLHQEAVAARVSVNDSTVRWFVNRLYEAMGRAKFATALQKAGLGVADVERTVRLDLVVRRFIETVVAAQVQVFADEARAWYDENLHLFEPHDSVRARHIVIRPGDNMIMRSQRIEDLRARVLAGEDFAELARQFSEGPSGPRGGDLGYFAHRDMVPEFSDVAFSLEPGDISEVVQTPFGFHVIQVLDRKTSELVTFEEARPQILARLRDQELNRLVQNHLLRARRAAIIEAKFDIGGLTQRESATFTR